MRTTAFLFLKICSFFEKLYLLHSVYKNVANLQFFPVFRDFQLGFYKCLNSNRISFKNLRFWVSRAIFAACLYVGRSTSRAAPASRWWTRAVADTMSCAALGQRVRNGRSSVLRPRGGNMSRSTATPSFPFSAKALTRGLRS